MSQPEEIVSHEVSAVIPRKEVACTSKVPSNSSFAQSSHSSSSIDSNSDTSQHSVDKRQTAELSMELQLKVMTQFDRLLILEECAKDLDSSTLSLEEIVERKCHAEELHKRFSKEHTHLETVWPSGHLGHDYFSKSVYLQFNRIYQVYKRNLAKAKASLIPSTAQLASSATRSNLPEIVLPEFSGDYLGWPNFCESFQSLIINNSELSNIEKLHYLRGALKGQPAQLISRLPLAGYSLQRSWDVLTAQYGDKHLFIQMQLAAEQ